MDYHNQIKTLDFIDNKGRFLKNIAYYIKTDIKIDHFYETFVMGVNDLNLLKSWNPNLLKNKQKVWKTREELKEENLKIKELESNIKEGNKPKDSLSWMYQGSDLDSKGKPDSSNLLDNLIKNKKAKQKTEAISLKDKQLKKVRDIKENKKKELQKEIFKLTEDKKVKKVKKKTTKFASEDPMSRF